MAPRKSCSRRGALAVIAGGLSGLAGCSRTVLTDSKSTTSDQPEATTQPQATSTNTHTETSTSTTEVCSTSTPDADHLYKFGEWHESSTSDKRGWRFTAVDLELTTTFRLDDSGETYKMPKEEQLAIVTTKVTNPTSEMDTWEHNEEFVIIRRDGTVAWSNADGGFQHPAFTDEVSFGDFRRVDHVKQSRPEGYPIDPGETRSLWWVMVVPRNVSERFLQVGFGGYHNESPDAYSVRWIQENQC